MIEKYFQEIAKIALTEDSAFNDITSDLTIEKNSKISFEINARQDLFLCGIQIIEACFRELKSSEKFTNSQISFDILKENRDFVAKNEAIAKGFGDAHLILAAERVMLNLMQHLSGITTLTNQFVKALDDKNIAILDTRKTVPGLRYLEKYAVLCGGGYNHRFNLFDMVLIKDNHIEAAGGIKNAILQAKKSGKQIEIECDNLSQVTESIKFAPDIIMLDNMTLPKIKEALKIIDKKCQVEISGGINLENIAQYKNSGVDFISSGALTNSNKAVDIALDIS